jgi:hypothetical protein
VSQFLGIAIFIVIAAGMAIHAGIDLPWYAHWIGQLPGDLLIKKAGLTIYVPITSSVLISVGLSFLLSLVSKK